MKLRKFFGPTSRSVLEQIRTELGPDAVIVANHPTAEGVEISALAGDAMESLLGAMPPPARRAAPVEPRATRAAAPLPSVPELNDAVILEMAFAPAPEPVVIELPADIDVAEAPVAAAAVVRDGDTTSNARLLDEFAAMRKLLEGQVAQLAWSDSVRRKPLHAQLTQELMAFGYSPTLVREVMERLPDDFALGQARHWLLGIIAQNLHCIEPPDDLVARGGVYALVGPTGVGKTTTAAKLAARCAVRHGSASLALLTTDSYRVGAQDQLRIYAKILGVSVQTVNDADDLRQALDALKAKHLVLIDTVGMGQRDQRLADHAVVLGQPEVNRLLLLNATSQAETLEEVVTAYGGWGAQVEQSLAGCIITKQDESARPGQVLDVVIRHRLRIHYVSNGQRVPEDLQTANAAYLAHRSFRELPQASPFRLLREEVPLMLTRASPAHA